MVPRRMCREDLQSIPDVVTQDLLSGLQKMCSASNQITFLKIMQEKETQGNDMSRAKERHPIKISMEFYGGR